MIRQTILGHLLNGEAFERRETFVVNAYDTKTGRHYSTPLQRPAAPAGRTILYRVRVTPKGRGQ